MAPAPGRAGGLKARQGVAPNPSSQVASTECYEYEDRTGNNNYDIKQAQQSKCPGK